jgi:hypothetical protein
VLSREATHINLVFLHQLWIISQIYFGQIIHCTKASYIRLGFQDSIVKLNPVLLRQCTDVVMRTCSYSVESKWPSPYTNAGVSGNEGSNTIWYVVDLPDSYVVYPSLTWPDWPVQRYQYKDIYISLFSIIPRVLAIFYLLNYQYFVFYHYNLSQCYIILLKHYHISTS